MRLVLLVRRRRASGTRGYLRAVDRAYQRVPVVGELVMLDDHGDIGHAIDQVSWDNDGQAVLRITNPPVSGDWLMAAGFELVYDERRRRRRGRFPRMPPGRPYRAPGPPRVALVTAAQAEGLDDDASVLLAALRRRGIEAQTCVWDDDAVDWSAWDLAVLRSTWDYPRRRDAFLRWAAHVDAVGALRNRPAVVAWNSDKRYLLELADRGVAIVPSTVHAPGEAIALPASGGFVVKPTVSAGAQDTERYSADEHVRARAHAGRLHAQGREVLVQPYVERVDDDGETALVFMGGRFSHAIRKGPILTGVPETVGGLFAAEQIDRRTPREPERAAAEAAMDALPFDRGDLLYARVDLVPGNDGRPLVLEVELVEPSLFLRFDDGAADRFARAIASWCSATSPAASGPA